MQSYYFFLSFALGVEPIVVTALVPGAVERFAGAHPSHCVGPFRSYGHGRPYLSIGTRDQGSALSAGIHANTNFTSARTKKRSQPILVDFFVIPIGFKPITF